MIAPLPNSIVALTPELTEWRRDLHRHPELAYRETRTAALVAERLRGFGLDAVETGIGGTGVVGVLHGTGGPGAGPAQAVMLRADMDALPMQEASGPAHKSATDGAMHACGHDGHTTMLLGAARHLAETRNFSGTVYFCFQPAEEQGAGARAMIRDGLLERFPFRAAFAMHTLPGLPLGAFSTRSGVICGTNVDFTLTVIGKGGHAAHPRDCVDTILPTGHLITALHGLVSRDLDPREAGVLSITSLRGGETFNVLPDQVRVLGTIRAFEAVVAERLLARLRAVADGVAGAHGVRIALELDPDRYPPTVNDAVMTEFATSVAAELVGAENIREQPAELGVEDFAFIAEARPSAYVCIGNGDSATLHHPQFDFDDRALPFGVAYFARLAERALPRSLPRA